jgi:hypothetical protein
LATVAARLRGHTISATRYRAYFVLDPYCGRSLFSDSVLLECLL